MAKFELEYSEQRNKRRPCFPFSETLPWDSSLKGVAVGGAEGGGEFWGDPAHTYPSSTSIPPQQISSSPALPSHPASTFPVSHPLAFSSLLIFSPYKCSTQKDAALKQLPALAVEYDSSCNALPGEELRHKSPNHPVSLFAEGRCCGLALDSIVALFKFFGFLSLSPESLPIPPAILWQPLNYVSYNILQFHCCRGKMFARCGNLWPMLFILIPSEI